MKTQNYFPFLVILLVSYTSYAQIGHLQVIGHQQGGFSDSLVSDAHFGQTLANIGDLDQDGIPDLGIGALYQDSVSERQYERLGAFYLNLMYSNGRVKQTINLTEEMFRNVFSGPDALGMTGRHGYAMEGIGDINQDGIPDIALGFPDYETNLQYKDAGGVLILLMDIDGSIKSHSWLDRTYFPSLQRDDRFGHSICALGDINQDGYTEIAISAPRHEVAHQFFGAVWIVSLLPNGTPYFYKKVENRYSQTANKYWAFGWSLESIPDMNGDGTPELLVGSPHGTYDLEPVVGNISLLFLNEALTVKDFKNINFYESDLARDNVSDDSHFGESIAYLGDLDGDGRPEIAVGGSLDEKMSEQHGRVWCLSLAANGEADLFFDLQANSLGKWLQLDPFERFGQQLCGAMDLNGDGQTELLAAARKPGGRGTVNVLFGLNLKLSRLSGEIEAPSLVLHPNPAQNIIQIEGLKHLPGFYQIIGLEGKVYAKGKMTAGAIDIFQLKSGTYYLQLADAFGRLKSYPFTKS